MCNTGMEREEAVPVFVSAVKIEFVFLFEASKAFHQILNLPNGRLEAIL